MFKVRFHLLRGPQFGHWQVKQVDPWAELPVQYFDPKLFQLHMFDCTLINKKGTAKRIFEGGEKNVCAWILCGTVASQPAQPKSASKVFKLVHSAEQLFYNPRVAPHWTDSRGINFDGVRLPALRTADHRVYNVRLM